jgi:protein-tyrosine phosphatase
MIDIHLHLLPGVDDGAASPEETRGMLARARALGFAVLVATPHLPDRLDPPYRERVASAFALTRELAAAEEIEVRPGFEVRLTPDLPRRLAEGEPITLGGSNAVLVDLPFGGWPHHVDQTLFAVQTAGFRPVLAHPERYAAVQDELARALRLAERGVLMQLNLGSLHGLFGKRAQRTAEALLRAGAVHAVATDAHSAGGRYAEVPKGLARLTELVGAAGRDRLLIETPAALLAGAPVRAASVGTEWPGNGGWQARLRRLARRP